MTCKENQEHIVLFLYEELSDSEKIELESHLQDCTNCNDSFEQQKSLHDVLAQNSDPWDVPSDLLIESRRSLANELDRIERKRTWWRLPAFSLVFSPMRLLEWTTLVAVGLAAGVYLHTYSPQAKPPALAPIADGSEPGTISNVTIVNSDSATGSVEMVGDLVRPLHFRGNLKDAAAQQLLVSALRDGRNASSRMSAVEALSRKADNMEIRDALIGALMEDDNPGVRLKALHTLKPYASQDKNVRAAFMYALANDVVAGIRVQAIDGLKHFAEDDTVARTVQEITKDDDNAYVKAQAIQFVGHRQ